MSYKKFYKPVNSVLPSKSGAGSRGSYANRSSWLPEVYQGPPDRLQRYTVYESMDNDHEIHAALDTIADFSTEDDDITKLPFVFDFKDSPSASEVALLSQSLKQWCTLNEFNKRIWTIFRQVLKYGDQFFIRDPETFKLMWVDQSNISKVIVNESKGKKIEHYCIKGIDLNTAQMVATNQHSGIKSAGLYSPPMYPGYSPGNASQYIQNSLNNTEQSEVEVDATHVVHIGLSDGMNAAWPFGISILEYIHKVFRQKELLEDAILIYRVHRAPERRVFFIDVGDMPPNMASQYLERMKLEVQQKRIPSRNGQGGGIGDATVNPMSMLEDYYFAVSCLALDTKIPLLDGRTMELQELIQEYNDGKVNYAYTVNQDTHELIPGKIVWGGVTRKNAEVVEVLLDNGEKLRVTPDHRFIMRDGSEKEAQYLTANDSLMPLYLIDAKTSSKQKGKPYLRYIDNKDGKVKWVHTAICPKTAPGKETEIHHIDFNSRNNCPTNLVEMDTKEHRDLHKAAGSYSLSKQWNSAEGREKLITGIHKAYENRSDEFKQMLSERNKQNGNTANTKKHTLENKLHISTQGKIQAEQKRIIYSLEMFNRADELVDEGFNSISKLTSKLREDKIYQAAFQLANPCIIRDKNKPANQCLTYESLGKLVSVAGYSSWGEYKEEKFNGTKYKNNYYNHKVVSVTFLSDREDTGDITIESQGGYHNFATAAGVYVHNSEGKGSKVETLPGGDNLGCFALDTKVVLLDGRELSISEIEAELATGKRLWTYSCHPETGAVLPGKIDWAGKTQENAKVRKITLSNGNSFICTDDHKFPMVNTGFVEAKDIVPGSVITNFNLDDNKVYDYKYGNRSTFDYEERVDGTYKISRSYASEYNTEIIHQEVVVESNVELDETMDVGTLTIDLNEGYHNYHTYALAAGVFAKNSIDDLRYFNNKMLRALGVPSSYLPSGPDDGSNGYNDGRVGTAFIQEFRFSKVCQRYQRQIIKTLDKEFKLFLKHSGITIDNSMFELSFTTPQSFSEYRRLELDSAKINQYQVLADNKYLSKRFVLRRYLGLTEEEIFENERLWKEESGKGKPKTDESSLSDAGFTPSGIDAMAPDSGFEPDDSMAEFETDDELDSELEPNLDTDLEPEFNV